jgi:hypothetical protein
MKYTLHMIPHSFNNTQKIKKREPNAFILFRSDLKKKYNMENVKMKDFSKFASEQWKKLSKEEKIEWQKKYHLNRDHKVSSHETIINIYNSPASINLTQIISASTLGNSDFNFICKSCESNIGSNPGCSNCNIMNL